AAQGKLWNSAGDGNGQWRRGVLSRSTPALPIPQLVAALIKSSYGGLIWSIDNLGTFGSSTSAIITTFPCRRIAAASAASVLPSLCDWKCTSNTTSGQPSAASRFNNCACN